MIVTKSPKSCTSCELGTIHYYNSSELYLYQSSYAKNRLGSTKGLSGLTKSD